jgi:hypothetical protein
MGSPDGIGNPAPRGIIDGFGQVPDLLHSLLITSAGHQLLEKLPHDVDADAAGAAASAGFLLDEPQILKGEID